MSRPLALLLALATLLSGCGDGRSSAPTSPAAPTSLTPTAPLPSDRGVAPSPDGSSPTTSLTPGVGTADGPVELTVDPRFVIASDAGVVRYEDGATTELAHDPAAIAVDDGAGGALMQFTQGFHASTEEDSSIYHARVATEEPVPVVEGNVDVTLSLHGIVARDGRVLAVFTVRRGTTPNDTREELFTYDVGTGDTRRVAEVGGWEEGPVSVSSGGNLHVLNATAGASRWFRFLGADGARVDVAHNPLPPDQPCTGDVTCPDNPALDPTGRHLAYTRLVPGDDGVIRSWELVVLDLGSGQVILRLPQGYDPGRAPRSVDTVGGLVVVSRGTADAERPSWSEPLVVDLSGDQPSVSSLPVRGLTTLARGG